MGCHPYHSFVRVLAEGLAKDFEALREGLLGATGRFDGDIRLFHFIPPNASLLVLVRRMMNSAHAPSTLQ